MIVIKTGRSIVDASFCLSYWDSLVIATKILSEALKKYNKSRLNSGEYSGFGGCRFRLILPKNGKNRVFTGYLVIEAMIVRRTEHFVSREI